ncbi:large conductance mechanosensitive channel protein MscL [Neobacillus muris]|uniref:large conductance mechanosensitive channel protein MscL n=1 Tax=Neobacillus muris TaxID=2941334 RepID=UPI00203AD038|nr:large conductance mechanosensitive channel protein MscL [Neobacillus muris]
MWKEFKQFAMKGNVLDLAIGVIIGGAFGKIVSSLVADIITPIIVLLTGRVHVEDLAYKDIKYGVFLQNVIDFFVIAFSIFLFVKFLNRFKRKEEPKKVEVKLERSEELLAEIRDLLKERQDLFKKDETS